MAEPNEPLARAVAVLGRARAPLSVVLQALEDVQAQDPASPAVAGQLERVRLQAEQVLRLIVTVPPTVDSADQAFLKRVAAAIDAGLADEAFGVAALAARAAVG